VGIYPTSSIERRRKQMENMTREQIEAEIRGLDQLMREKDYIGTKIAMGRATIEEYAEEIAESDRMAARKNELKAMLKEMDEEA
jgi:hypothetical protein